MSDSDSNDFPKLQEDGNTSYSESEDKSDENDSEDSEKSEEQISASALMSALSEAGQNEKKFDNLCEIDRLAEDFLVYSFNEVRLPHD